MPNKCKECFYKQNNVPEGGHCYMFKEEMPDCGAFKPLLENKTIIVGAGSSVAKDTTGVRSGISILGSSLRGGVSAKTLLTLAALGSVSAHVVSEENGFAKAMAGPFSKNEPSFPAAVNRHREGKTKRPKKW